VHPERVQDSAVALVIDGRAGDRVVQVNRRDRVGREDALTLIGAVASAQPVGTLLVVGPALAGVVDVAAGPVHVASPRHHCTAVWIALSEHLDIWRRQYGHILVADYDHRLEHLHTAAIAPNPSERA
jgi:hypothetical protein